MTSYETITVEEREKKFSTSWKMRKREVFKIERRKMATGKRKDKNGTRFRQVGNKECEGNEFEPFNFASETERP